MATAQTIAPATSAWINKYGAFYAVEYASHWTFATQQWQLIDPAKDYSELGDPVRDLENAGWIHISNSESDMHKDPFIIARTKINGDQFDALFDWAMAHQSAGNTRFAQGIQRYIEHRMETMDSDNASYLNPYRESR